MADIEHLPRRKAMSRLIFAVASLLCLLGISGPVQARDSKKLCVMEVTLEIKRIVPGIYVRGEDRKHSAISLLMPVDCQSGVYLKPDTLAQALRWLDLALPIDYKAGLLKDNTYLHSPYGSSVDSDLVAFLQDHWSLVKRNPLCAEAWAAMAEAGEAVNWDDEEIEYCGPEFLDLLRKNLLAPHCAIPEGNRGFSEPSGCVPLPRRTGSEEREVDLQSEG